MKIVVPLCGFLLAALCLSAEEPSSVSPSSWVDSEALVSQALHTFRSTGSAPVLKDGLLVRFPFGSLPEPSLNCGPTSFCDLQLEAGETVLGIAAADPSWIAERLVSGSSPHATPHLVLKPTEWGVSSSLLVTTTRRAYLLHLTADRDRPITSNSGFYYPRDILRYEADEQAAQAAKAERDAETVVAAIPDLAELRCGYSIRGKEAPVLACDDGTRTFLSWGSRPPRQAPAVFAIDEHGNRSILNHRSKGNWYVLDAVAPRFELKAGRQTVVISRSR